MDFPLTPDPRYALAGPREPADAFEIVYVGSLAVHKGVPLLIDAVRRLPHLDLRLRLVGGWGTPGMRRFVQSACAGDRRISVCPGDPLPHLRGARLCVHPAYEDGFAYAPAEALAAGVPVIVSEDTGMKELIEPGRDGVIVPTGDLDALTQAIEAAYRGELLSPSAREREMTDAGATPARRWPAGSRRRCLGKPARAACTITPSLLAAALSGEHVSCSEHWLWRRERSLARRALGVSPLDGSARRRARRSRRPKPRSCTTRSSPTPTAAFRCSCARRSRPCAARACR